MPPKATPLVGVKRKLKKEEEEEEAQSPIAASPIPMPEENVSPFGGLFGLRTLARSAKKAILG